MYLCHIHQTIVENMTEAVHVRDRDMNILYINPLAEKLVGQSLQQAKGKKCFELFGDQEALLTVMLNITERKKAQEELEESRGELSAIFDSISDAIVFTDKERRVVRVNPSFTSMWGYRADEVSGRTTEFLYRDKSDYLEMGKKRYHAKEMPLAPLEMEYRRKDGSIFSAESFGTQVKDSCGNTKGLMGVHKDITECKKIENALRESEKKYRSVVENMQDVFYRTDLQG
jgi:PAS domain S-box-containing protein